MITLTHRGQRLSLLVLAISLLASSPVSAMNPAPNAPQQTASVPVVGGILSSTPRKLAVVAIGIFTVGTLINVLKPVQRVGVVTIEGMMIESGKTVKELQTFFKNPLIKAIVLKINSGGGAPGTSQALYHVVNELKKTYKKPVIAWIENIAASGAYYAACSADIIIASPSAMVGSVGVIGQIWQLKNALKRFDVGKETITSGDYKAFSDPFNAITAEQKAMYQKMCDRTYKRFVTDVQQRRPKLAELPVEEWANGKVFDAEHGLELGMVDLLGSQVTVEQAIKDLTHDTRTVEFVYPPSLPSFMSHLDKQKLAISTMVDEVWDRLEQKMEQSGSVRIKLVG